MRQYQRNRLDHDVGLETHKDVLHSVIDHPNSPIYLSCACEEALKLHTDVDGIVGYDFFAETCSCEDCLKMYVYLLCDRQCVCPKCFNEATKEGHERAETARRLFASSDDAANAPENWSDIATHFGRLSSQRTLRHIEELLQRLRQPVLALPPTPPSRRRRKPPPKIELRSRRRDRASEARCHLLRRPPRNVFFMYSRAPKRLLRLCLYSNPLMF